MSTPVDFHGFPVDQVTSLLTPDSILILDRNRKVFSITAGYNGDPSLSNTAILFSQLPPLSWLHLVKINDLPEFLLSHPIDQEQIVFLTFPSTTRIHELEGKLALLQDVLNSQTPGSSAGIALELTAKDLRTDHANLPEQENFLSIFSDLEKSVANTRSKTLNEGDTQPISL